MIGVASMKKGAYVVVHNEETVCFFYSDAEGSYQVTNDLEEARRQCDWLRRTHPKDRYEVKSLSFSEVTHPGPDWNQGM